ncbi:L-threonylcarbamoyladenylate synthase [Desulfococcus multivorans]|uniref:L-threonylcarbamoyladenylate synthase n=1 Tax=Desulfococcus multivorans DSM 2059 TaxID=1121405 RepID=S7UF61_DESML|nr:L-threonylcarbamoyladenylate synthase [Desulfococcus multivorans]AOY60503.1 Sua5/YciO/YrdC/YwlC family protein [Desulfococcus multivorans]AQV02602.1 threonylcarbamoyl-AMP synthase [Desulfococcus multivorans]EPR32454.1 Sua5/YciO/YrdC/YwlC family protein [Desulfococcus multivorans DSM 2059]SKA24496.1 L-threonylcarbamoyladenylate synthase [Desulfococcus multivorans DSM 2059]
MSETRRIDAADPANPYFRASIREAAARIRSGGVVVFPTRCLYGLGADARDPAAVGRVFDIKLRPKDKPILVLVHRMSDVERFAERVPAYARRIMTRIWPGGVTLVFEASAGVCPLLTAGSGKIGIRLCAHPAAKALLEATGGPITGTSANISEAPACDDISRLDPRIAAAVDLILDAGPLAGGIGSTVVDVTGDHPRILRDGAIPATRILEIAQDRAQMG